MRAKSLRLVNIRSYTHETVEFPQGTTLFEGDIGSGKSTILLAIEFALFGLGNQRGASLLRLGAKDGSVTFTFEMDGNEYEVHRNLVRKRKAVQQGEGYLKINGKRYDLSPTELKEKILEILRFNEPPNPNAQSVIYRYVVFTPQEEMKSILWARPQDRLQTMRKAFGIEDYKTAAENAKNLASVIKDRCNVLEGQTKDLEEKRKELETKSKEIEQLTKSLKKLTAEREKLEAELEKQEQEMETLTEQEKELASITALLPKLKDDIRVKTVKISDLRRENADYQKEIEKLQPQIDELKQLEKPTDKEEAELEKEIQELRNRERELLQAVNSLNVKIEDYQQIIEKQVCPTCDRRVDPKEFGEKLETRKQERTRAEEERRKFAEKIESMEELLGNLRNYNADMKRLEQLTQNLEERKNRITKNLEEVLELSNQIQSLDAEMKRHEKRLEELKDVSQKIAQTRELIDGLRNKKEKLTRDISGTEKQIEIYKQEKTRLEAEIREKKKMRQTKKLLDEHRIWLQDYFAPTLENIEKHVMRNINQEFNRQIQKWFNILVDDPSKTVRVDEEFTPIVEQDGYEQNVQFMSGGEKTSLALVYRLALNTIVRKVSTAMKSNILILDEPTDGFSKEQLFKVREILNELGDAQVILVSHERELESFADQVFRVEKINGVSKVEPAA
ncbi:MAG: AAA family ATPase [Candidatus Freyarchaeota archaeon]